MKVTVATRSHNVIDFRCDSNVAAQFAMLAQRVKAQGGRARDLAPVSRRIIYAVEIVGRAATHVGLPALARVVLAGGAGRSPLPYAKAVETDHRLGQRSPNVRRPTGERYRPKGAELYSQITNRSVVDI